MAKIELLDVVALVRNRPELGLVTGQVGTVVEKLDGDIWEVEFCDDQGRTYRSLALSGTELMVLVYHPVAAA